MLNNVISEKIYMSCFKNNLSSASRIFYIYLLFNINSSNEYFLNDTAYICYLFSCGTRTLYNWINELSSSGLIKYDKKSIFVY